MQGAAPSTDQIEGRRLALVVEYDGTRYSGFQLQANAPTVQGEIERAVRSLTGQATRVRAASRTDAGAHARGQIVDFLTHAPYTTETFVNSLNSYLPLDVRVRAAFETGPTFNSRKDAVSRVYRYTLLNSKYPSALRRDFSHWIASCLDVERMRRGAEHLVGKHDFSAFAGSLAEGGSAVRRVSRWDVWREKELVIIESEANGFLPHQIRRTNGVLAKIGLGRAPVDTIGEMLEGTIQESGQCPSLPAKGLCLIKVHYKDLLFSMEEDYEAG